MHAGLHTYFLWVRIQTKFFVLPCSLSGNKREREKETIPSASYKMEEEEEDNDVVNVSRCACHLQNASSLHSARAASRCMRMVDALALASALCPSEMRDVAIVAIGTDDV